MIRVIATKKFGDDYKQLITDAAKADGYTLEEQYTDAEGSFVYTEICTPKR